MGRRKDSVVFQAVGQTGGAEMVASVIQDMVDDDGVTSLYCSCGQCVLLSGAML